MMNRMGDCSLNLSLIMTFNHYNFVLSIKIVALLWRNKYIAQIKGTSWFRFTLFLNLNLEHSKMIFHLLYIKSFQKKKKKPLHIKCHIWNILFVICVSIKYYWFTCITLFITPFMWLLYWSSLIRAFFQLIYDISVT